MGRPPQQTSSLSALRWNAIITVFAANFVTLYIMPTLPTRYDLLHARLGRLPPLLRRVESDDPLAWPSMRVALWRLRELLPVLRLAPETARKLGVRLRRIGRQLGKVRELDGQISLVNEVSESDRHARPAATRVTHDLKRRRVRLGADVLPQKAAEDVRRVLRKLNLILADLDRADDPGGTLRAIRWAIKARVARRAAMLKRALDDAGSVYLPGRLREVRSAARKLRFAAELVADVVASPGAPSLGTVEQTQDALDRLRDTERLIVRARRLQGGLTPPDLKAWQELDVLVAVLENRCRRLHARYVRERAALLALCARWGARASVPDAPRRKVS